MHCQRISSKFFIAIFLFLNIAAVEAETFKISVVGSEIKNLTAIELKLDIDPAESFVLEEQLEVFDWVKNPQGELERQSAQARVLYKVADPVHNSIRVFFFYPNTVHRLEIDGSILRSNYSGVASIKIKEINYISDFSLTVNPAKLNATFELTSSEESLPYKGISKAEILGPKERIFNENIFVSIGNIETYGFKIDEKINKLRINGVEAKLIDNTIIAARLKLNINEVLESLPIVLEIEVDNQTVTKEVGVIHFFENLN